jgi:hypothetical protein
LLLNKDKDDKVVGMDDVICRYDPSKTVRKIIFGVGGLTVDFHFVIQNELNHHLNAHFIG